MTELELKLSLPDQLATQAKAAGLLTSEAIERLVREAIRKAAAQRLIEYGRRLREPGGPDISEAELESELKAQCAPSFAKPVRAVPRPESFYPSPIKSPRPACRRRAKKRSRPRWTPCARRAAGAAVLKLVADTNTVVSALL